MNKTIASIVSLCLFCVTAAFAQASSDTLAVSVNYKNGINYLVENCNTNADELVFELKKPVLQPYSVRLVVAGTASRADYTLSAPPIVVFSDNQTKQVFTIIPTDDNLIEGKETLKISVVSLDGRRLYQTISIDIYDKPNVQTFADKDTILACKSSDLQLIATGAASYIWKNTNTSNPNIANPTVKNATDGWYVVKGTIGKCVASDSTFVKTVDTPMLKIASNQTKPICPSDSVLLNIINNVGNYGLTWTPTTGLTIKKSGVVARPKETTTYKLTSQLANCAVSDNVQVNVLPLDIDIVKDTIYLCKGKTATLIAKSSNPNITWTPNYGNLNVTTGTTVIASPAAHTKYFARIPTGVCNVVDSIVVRVDSLPSPLIFVPDPIKKKYCKGDLVYLTSEIYEPKKYMGIKHKWISGAGRQTPDINYNMVFNAEKTSVFTRITSNYGCVDTTSLPIPVVDPEELKLTWYDTLACVGYIIPIRALNGMEHKWSPPGVITVPEGPITAVNVTTGGVVSVTAKIDGCPVQRTANVTLRPQPTLGLPTDRSLCDGESIILNNRSDASTTYSWTSNDPNFPATTTPQPTAKPVQSSAYMLTAKRGVCTIKQTIDVILSKGTLTPPKDVTICQGESATLTANGNLGGKYEWSDGQLGTSISIKPNATRDYTVLYTFGDKCTLSAKATVKVGGADVVINPILTPGNKTVELGSTIRVAANGVVASTAKIEWFENGNAISGETKTEYAAKPKIDPTIYKIRITTVDGCVKEASVTFNVVRPRIDVPNGFTPNGDTHNDFFNVVVQSGSISVKEMRIFNRWGQLVYNNDTPSTGWDGTKGGTPLPSDVYIYQLIVLLADGSTETRAGDVTLLR
jgi:gliding motility-associated-like protein